MTSKDFPADILIVDLDGTLLRSDMLYESFWSALGQDWRVPVQAGLALQKGKPALKDYLAQIAKVDVATLPYNEDVVAFVRARREQGIRTVLVTATSQRLADAIAAHLDLFDEVHGTKEGTNLKGPNKAAFLKETFNGKKLAYMGMPTPICQFGQWWIWPSRWMYRRPCAPACPDWKHRSRR